MSTRKPAHRRVRSQTRDIGLVKGADLEAPTAPKPGGRAMLKSTQTAWAKFWSSDVAALVVDADRPALDRLFGLYDARLRMERVALKSPFSTGSMGQLRAHPALAEVASLDARIVPLEDRFGITPAGRLKLGIVLGAAAKSLEDLNASFTDDEDDDSDDRYADPRLRVIDTGATG